MNFPFAFDLASPAMLGWLAAALTPLLIHLWSRRRYREMSWAAMEYLLAAIKSSRRKFVVEQWLLLLVRTLLVIAVVLAVSEPFWSAGPLAFVPGERTHRMLVLDGSYSMAYKPEEVSRFETAKELATQIVNQCPRGDGFTLVLMSAPAKVVVGTPVFEPDDFLQQLESLTLPHAGSNPSSSVLKIQQVLDRVRREHSGLHRHEVYFFTDLCREGWIEHHESAMHESDSSDRLHQQMQRLARSAAITVFDVGQADAENTAVTGLDTTAPFVTVSERIDLEADIRNFGPTARNRLQVELVVNGRRVEQRQVDLPGRGEVSVPFTYRFESVGDHALEIRLAGDRLELDDRRYLALPVRRAVQVLCVDGHPSGRAFDGATDFLASALSPHGTTSGYDRVHASVVPESAILEMDLGRYDCIFLADVAQFISSEAQVLESYVQGGGSLVFFLGPRVLADRYNRELAGERAGGVDLLPARLGSVVAVPESRLDPLGYRHPIVRAFRGHERAGLLTTPVAKHFQLVLPEGSRSKTALATSNGDPLIVERPVGRGRVILVGTSADTSWTLMPVWPSYVSIIQEILAFTLAGERKQRNFDVGQSLGNTLGRASGDAPLAIQPPGNRDPVRIRPESETGAWSFTETNTSGIYTVQIGPPVDRDELHTVNVATAESDLAKLTPEAFREEVWPDVPLEYRTTWKQPSVTATVGSVGQSGLAKAFLYLVVVLLFVETFLARRFGYHGT